MTRARRPGRRITKVLAYGPRKRSVLAGLLGGEHVLAPVLAALLARGRIKKIGDRKGTLYALSTWRRGSRAP